MTPGERAAGRRARAEVHEGMALFVELARVVWIVAAQERLRSYSLPYPREAQLVLDRTVLYCLGRGMTPPRSVPELMSWCRQHPAGAAVFQVPPSFVLPDATLVDPVAMMPTRTCVELASFGPQGQTEQEAVCLMTELAARCGTVEAYARSRRFLMESPVVRQRDRFSRRGPWNAAVWNRVKDLYGPVPESLLADQVLAVCGTCELPALARNSAASSAESWCESESCPPGVPFGLIRDPEHALVLRPSLRAFLAMPRQTEQAMLDELARAKAVPELIAGDLGTYRIHNLGSRTCFVRAYDRQQPALLAARVADSLADADGLALVVVPRRLADRSGYRAAFQAAMGGNCHERVVLTPPEDLVRHVPTRHAPQTETENGNA